MTSSGIISGPMFGSSLVIQPDGKLVVAGVAGGTPNEASALIARYTGEGGLDPTFGGTGIVTTPIQAGGGTINPVVKRQADGKFVMSGSYSGTEVGDIGHFAARYLSEAEPPPPSPAPALTVTLKASVVVAEVGQPVSYTYRITNSGEITLTGLVATDNRLGPVSLTGTTLVPGAGLIAGLVYTPAAADLGCCLAHTIRVTGTAQPPVTATATLALPVQDTLPPVFPAQALITPTRGISLTFPRPTFRWQAATDYSGVASYTLNLGGPGLSLAAVWQFTTTQPVYTPTAHLAPGVYTWTVRAYDLAGNTATATPPAYFGVGTTGVGRRVYLPGVRR